LQLAFDGSGLWIALFRGRYLFKRETIAYFQSINEGKRKCGWKKSIDSLDPSAFVREVYRHPIFINSFFPG
jgi:hypothetical protein